MGFREDWDKYLALKWKESMDAVLSENLDINKLESHALKMGVSVGEFLTALEDNNKFAIYIMAKTPSRQNYAETFQADWINLQLNNDAVSIMPKKNDYTWEYNGHETNTVDAIVKIGDKNYFTCMKLITGKGGTQDRSRKEAKDFLTITKGADPDGNFLSWVDDTEPLDPDFVSSEMLLNMIRRGYV